MSVYRYFDVDGDAKVIYTCCFGRFSSVLLFLSSSLLLFFSSFLFLFLFVHPCFFGVNLLQIHKKEFVSGVEKCTEAKVLEFLGTPLLL